MKNRKGVTSKQTNAPGKLFVLSEQEWNERKNTVLSDRAPTASLPNVDISEGDIEEPLDFLK
jgi:hypothetical protein